MQTIQQTIEKAGLRKGGKYTVFRYNGWGFPCEDRITVEGVESRPYAQYTDAVRILFRPYRKKKLYYMWIYGGSPFRIIEGWQEIDRNLYMDIKVENGIVSETYEMCDYSRVKNIDRAFGDKIIASWQGA